MNITRKITTTAIFAAIATITMFFEFPLPFIPPFLKIDLSGTVILVGMFCIGIMPTIAMALIKDVFHALSSTTGGAGELADFLMTVTLVLVVYLFVQGGESRKRAILGCACGTFAMSIVGVITNKFIIIPFYAMFIPVEEIIQMSASVNPLIGSLNGYLLFGVLPFNLLKGTIISILALLVQQKLRSSMRYANIVKTNKNT